VIRNEAQRYIYLYLPSVSTPSVSSFNFLPLTLIRPDIMLTDTDKVELYPFLRLIVMLSIWILIKAPSCWQIGSTIPQPGLWTELLSDTVGVTEC